MALFTFIIIGFLAVAAAVIYRGRIIEMFGHLSKNHDPKTLPGSYWSAGLRLFAGNAVLFIGTAIVLYLLTYLYIPYLHLLVMFLAVIASIHMWSAFHRAWEGSSINRLKVGFVGSSFYVLLGAIFMWRMQTVQPSYPGEDMFMATFGLFFGVIVATVAFVTCLLFTGVSIKKR